MLGGRLAADELQEDSMLEDTDNAADKRTDTESELLERGAPSRDVACEGRHPRVVTPYWRIR